MKWDRGLEKKQQSQSHDRNDDDVISEKAQVPREATAKKIYSTCILSRTYLTEHIRLSHSMNITLLTRRPIKDKYKFITFRRRLEARYKISNNYIRID